MPSWIGWPEIVVVVVLALVIFGPKRLPELGASLGKAITGFKKGLSDTERELRKATADGEGPDGEEQAGR
jgi:sec-independent protein translocase protein TatA